MSLEQIESSIRTAMYNHETVDAVANCRDSANWLMELSQDIISQMEGQHTASFLGYRDPKTGTIEHYAVLIKDKATDEMLLLNSIPAAGFPQFIGRVNSLEQAHPMFTAMENVTQVV